MAITLDGYSTRTSLVKFTPEIVSHTKETHLPIGQKERGGEVHEASFQTRIKHPSPLPH